MRITKLEITNFQGLRHAALDVSAPVLLVAGHNGAGKSSLLDAISHAFTGKPGRVAQKQHIGQLITEGAKKGEARVEWLDESGEVQVCGVALPSGKGSPLADSPFLPFVLDASRFAALDAKQTKNESRSWPDWRTAPADKAIEHDRADDPIDDNTYFVMRNAGGAVFVKHGPFFRDQGGLTEDWGKNWTRIRAGSLKHARQIGEGLLP
ncbi:Uncharacterized protein PAE221_02479 [Pseudomonas aeruginosa]|nr:Uncharacterized protein PAE221_02479 [Pseudomonas aeruginosa]